MILCTTHKNVRCKTWSTKGASWPHGVHIMFQLQHGMHTAQLHNPTITERRFETGKPFVYKQSSTTRKKVEYKYNTMQISTMLAKAGQIGTLAKMRKLKKFNPTSITTFCLANVQPSKLLICCLRADLK